MFEQLINTFKKTTAFTHTKSKILDTTASFSIKYLNGGAKSVLLASLLNDVSAYPSNSLKFLLIVPDNDALSCYLDDLAVLGLQERLFNLSWIHSLSDSSVSRRVGVDNYNHLQSTQLSTLLDNLSQFSVSISGIAVASKEVFGLQLPSNKLIREQRHILSVGDKLDMILLGQTLTMNGFRREQYVSRQGEYAIRGGIFDIFAPNMVNPVRVELWGEVIDSVREFDPLSQRSLSEMRQVTFLKSLFIEEEVRNSSIYDYIGSDVIVVLDTPDVIGVSAVELGGLSSYRQISINPVGISDIMVKCDSQPSFQSDTSLLLRELFN